MTQVTFKVEISTLLNKAEEFDSTRQTIMQLIEEMKSKVQSMWAVWTGNAAEAYKNKFAQLEDDIEYLNRVIMEHVQDLKDIAAEYTQAGTSVESLIEQLPIDIIK